MAQDQTAIAPGDIYDATAATARTLRQQQQQVTPPPPAPPPAAPAAPASAPAAAAAPPAAAPPPAATGRAVQASIAGDPMAYVGQSVQKTKAILDAKAKDEQLRKARDVDVAASIDKTQKTMAATTEQLEQLGMDARNALKPWDVDKETAKYTTPTVEKFGSFGVSFALLASAFTHTPMVNALNGAAAAMNAITENDNQKYARAYDAWKANTDLAIKRNDLLVKDMHEIIDIAAKQPDLALAKAKALAAKYDDRIADAATLEGISEKYVTLADNRALTGAQVDQINSGLVPYHMWRDIVAQNPQWTKQQALDAFNAINSSGVSDVQVGLIMAGVNPGTAVPGLGGPAADQRKAAINKAGAAIMAQHPGMTQTQAGIWLAKQEAEFAGGKNAIRVNYNQEGGTRAALGQLEWNVNEAAKLLKELPGSYVPLINAVIKGEQEVTGNAKTKALFFYLKSASLEAQKIMSGGALSAAGITDAGRQEANDTLSKYITPQQFLGPGGLRDAMEGEARNRLQTIKAARQAIESESMGGTDVDNSPPQGSATEPDINGVYHVQTPEDVANLARTSPGARYVQPNDPNVRQVPGIPQ